MLLANSARYLLIAMDNQNLFDYNIYRFLASVWYLAVRGLTFLWKY